MNLQPREKKLLLLLAVVAVTSGIALYFINKPMTSGEFVIYEKEEQTQTSSVRPSQSARPGTSSQSQGGNRSSSAAIVTLENFQLNRSIESCWVLLEGKVFDISNFLKMFSEYQNSALEFCGTVGFEVGFIRGNISLTETIKEYSTELGVLG